MELILSGHDYKYAVEQIMLLMFPEERPVYVECDEGGAAFARSELAADEKTSRTLLRWGGREVIGEAEFEGELPADEMLRKRETQKLVKLSFFKATREATCTNPPWGFCRRSS